MTKSVYHHHAFIYFSNFVKFLSKQKCKIIPFILAVIFTIYAVSSTSSSKNYNRIAKIIRYATISNVHSKRSRLYKRKRRLRTGLCNNIFPDLIVVSKSNYDVSQIVTISRANNEPISIRSGDHSYVCSNIKPGKVQLKNFYH